MAMLMIASTTRRTGDPRRSSQRSATTEHEPAADSGSTDPGHVEHDEEIIDFWGSRDSLSLLANWG